jgi:PmbA protein
MRGERRRARPRRRRRSRSGRARARALEAEDAALAVPGVTNSSGGSASASASTIALATSHGFVRRLAAPPATAARRASSPAKARSAMQRDYAWHSARHLADLEAAEEIGRRAASGRRRGSIRCGPSPADIRSCSTRASRPPARPFRRRDQRLAIARKSSFLQDKLGSRSSPRA